MGGIIPEVSGPSQRRGVTLLELLITVLIAAAAIAGTMQGVVSSLRLASETHTRLLAIKGVQEYYLEYLRSLPFDHQDLAFGFRTGVITPALDPASGTDQLPDGRAQYWVDPDQGSQRLKRVTIQVDWTDAGGHGHSSVVSTLISCHGLTDPLATDCPP